MNSDRYEKNSMSLLEYLQTFGVSRAHIARLTGISRCYMSNMLTGRNPMTLSWIYKVMLVTDGYVSRERCADLTPPQKKGPQ